MRKISIKCTGILLAFIMVCASIWGLSTSVHKVSAGATKNYVLSGISVSGNSLNLGDWLVDGNIYARNSKIRFDKEKVGNNSSLTATTKINNLRECGMNDLFTAEMTVAINELCEEPAKIEFIFGMNSVRNISEASDCLKIIFEKFDNTNKIALRIVESYGDEKGDIEVLEKTKVIAIEYGKEFNLYVGAGTDQSVDISLDDAPVLTNYRTGVDLSGYFCVYSEGKNDFSLSEPQILAYTYIVAENVDYLETFDNGEYNSNIFYSEALALDYTPSRLSVNDEGALEFLNTNQAYFSTKYAYSNYELEFDLFDLVAKNELDEDGKIIRPATGRIGIGSGENYKGTVPAFEHNDIWLLLWGDRPAGAIFEMLDHFEARKIESMSKFNLWDNDFIKGRRVNVKYTSTDGYIQLFLKFDGEYPIEKGAKEYDAEEAKFYEYQCYFECDTGKSEAGHVKIFSFGNANYKIDNLSIKNTDYVGVRKSLDADELGFKSNRHDKTPDFDYKSSATEDDLLKQRLQNGTKVEVKEETEQSGCSSSIVSGVGAALLPIVCGALMVWRKKS